MREPHMNPARRTRPHIKKNIASAALCVTLLLTGCQSPTGTPQPTDAPAATQTVAQTAAPVAQAAPSVDDGSIRARMNAPENLVRTFASNTGKTQVVINADLEVPDVSSVNLYEVTAREIPAGNVTAFADHIIGEGAWTGDKEYRPPKSITVAGDFDGVTSENMFIASQQMTERGVPLYGIDVYAERQNGVFRGGQLLNYNLFATFFQYNYGSWHDLHGKDAQGCKYSYAEAQALAEEAAAVLAPELSVVSGGVMSESGKQAYLFAFTRSVDGIPVTYTRRECSYTDDDANGDPIFYRMIYPYESLRLVVDNDGVVNGRYESPYVLSDPLETDVELLPFGQVLDVVEKILPLTFAWLEDTYQIQVEIDRITFGYTRLDFKDDMYRYKLVPVWDFFGTSYNYIDGQLIVSHTEDYNSLLTVNAMDGTVVDRRFGF